MTDRELLGLAAKAAGILCTIVDLSNGVPVGTNIYNETIFDPLTDDGDALRLAVKLHLLVNIDETVTEALDGKQVEASDTHNGDAYTATRRAIVRAAAEIGKELK